jgi:hypothetical protein
MLSIAPRIAFGIRRLWVIAVALLGLAGSFVVMGAQPDAASASTAWVSISAGLQDYGDQYRVLGRAWR